MTKNRFVELKLNGRVIIRERNRKGMSQKLKSLNVAALLEHPKVQVYDVVTSMPFKNGNIFEATL